MFEVMNLSTTGQAEVIAKAPEGATDDRPDLRFVVISIAAVVVSVWLAYLVWDHGSKKLFVPRSDYATLAGVVLLAAAIERLLEPLSSYLLPADADKKDANEKKAEAKTAASDPTVAKVDVETKVQQAANADAKITKRKKERQIAFWAIATVVGLFAAALMGVFLIGAIADLALGSRPNRVLDLAVTGLVIGAGTKPTHDLIESLSKKADPPSSS